MPQDSAFYQALVARDFKSFALIVNTFKTQHGRCYNESLMNELNSLDEKHDLYQRALTYLIEIGYEEQRLVQSFEATNRDHRTLSEEIYEHQCDILGFRESEEE